jgi:hypothetical protein
MNFTKKKSAHFFRITKTFGVLTLSTPHTKKKVEEAFKIILSFFFFLENVNWNSLFQVERLQ